MNRLLTVALLAAAMTGCCCTGGGKNHSEEVRYCKHGVSVTEPTPGQYVEEPIETDIRPPAWYLLISADDSYFKIYRPHCTALDIQPPWQKICIKKDDAVTIKVEGDNYKLTLKHENTLIATGELKLEAPDNVWLEGEAILANPPMGQDPRVGKFFVYARPMEHPCRHTQNSIRECRSIFVEYYAYKDKYSEKYLPTMTGTNPTVTEGVCPAPPTGAETGDGEGDHGPIKP